VIYDEAQLQSLAEEIAVWDLQARRQYLVDLEKGLGKEAADQVKAALREFWAARNK
jgi:hypothetical protein